MFNPSTLFSIAKGILFKNSPFYVQYYIIAQCNLACRMCNIVEANSDLVPSDLSDVEKVAKNMKKIGAGVVLLTGGEPFMHQQLDKIVKIMVDNGLSPRLQTAGLATLPQLQKTYDAGARHINVSLDSLVEEKQDYLNGNRKGSWRQAIRAIADINKVFRSKKRLCALGCVLSAYNYKELPAIVEFATRIGWWVSMVPVHITPPDEAKNFRGTDSEFLFNPSQFGELDALLEKLIGMKKDHLLFDSEQFLRSSFNYLKTGEVTWRKFNQNVCDSPSLYFAVLPNGDFAVCCDHRFKGRVNLAQDDFPKVYRSAEFRKAVYSTTSSCKGCNYGSYPEMTLLARDRKAMMERFRFFSSKRAPQIPDYSFEQILEIAHEIREKHQLSAPPLNLNRERPPASSQRYGGVKVLSRKDAVMEWKENSEGLRRTAYRK